MGGEEDEGGPFSSPNLSGRVHDEVYQPRTGPKGADQSLWAQETMRPHSCCACSRWKEQIIGDSSAQLGLAEEEEGHVSSVLQRNH